MATKEALRREDLSQTLEQQTEPLRAGTFFAALLLTAISLYWMLQAGILSHGVQLGEAVPVIPAFGAVFFLTLLGLALRRLGSRLRVSQAQILYIYIFLCLSVTMNSVGVARLLFPNITALFYFQTPENDFASLQKFIPSWMAPQDPMAIQAMYEGSPDGQIPWRAWAEPLAMWLLFLTAWSVAMLGLMALFRQQWVEKERLNFPIAQLILDISDQKGERILGGFFGNPLMWIGFGLSTLFNIGNILHAWNPAIPAMGQTYDIGRFFTERPLSAIRPLTIAWRPENIGLGYLVSTEITLSVWVFYLLLRISNVIATGAGAEIAGFPFDREQSFGAYVALGLFLLWVARFHLRDMIQRALTYGRDYAREEEPMSARTALLCAVGGFLFMVGFAVKAGMYWWTALIYFGLILLFALVYARARAEAGAAMVWLFPFYLHKQMMIHIGGSQLFARSGGFQNLTIFSTFMFASRGYFQSNMAYHGEAMKIGQEARLKQRTLAWWMTSAIVVGFIGAAYVHLWAYYNHGANILEGGTTEGGYRVYLARTEFEELSSFMKAHRPPDRPRTFAGLTGAIIVVALILLRSYSLRFPLHPLGYAMVTAYGWPLWGPFFLVWLAKTIILRVGGMRAYRRGIPFFLGLMVGHYFVTGLIWGWLSIINEMYRRYCVFFG